MIPPYTCSSRSFLEVENWLYIILNFGVSFPGPGLETQGFVSGDVRERFWLFPNVFQNVGLPSVTLARIQKSVLILFDLSLYVTLVVIARAGLPKNDRKKNFSQESGTVAWTRSRGLWCYHIRTAFFARRKPKLNLEKEPVQVWQRLYNVGSPRLILRVDKSIKV